MTQKIETFQNAAKSQEKIQVKGRDTKPAEDPERLIKETSKGVLHLEQSNRLEDLDV